jgi:hypothetical protein
MSIRDWNSTFHTPQGQDLSLYALKYQTFLAAHRIETRLKIKC